MVTGPGLTPLQAACHTDPCPLYLIHSFHRSQRGPARPEPGSVLCACTDGWLTQNHANPGCQEPRGASPLRLLEQEARPGVGSDLPKVTVPGSAGARPWT